MIYLRHMWARSGLPAPESVSLHTESLDWVDVQVESEFRLLFPDSRVVVNPMDREPAALRVLVFRNGPEAAGDVTAWAQRERETHRQRETLIGLGLYCLDPRHFEVVPAGSYEAWAKRRRAVATTTKVRTRLPRLWAHTAALYERCASFS